MRHGSLFSGIGGFDLAAEWMGWENVFHCDNNPFVQKVLNFYWPDAKIYDDITETDFRKYEGKIDIITGGFPCQPFSTAGRRKGSKDDRYLWPEMLRVIKEIKPRYVVGENVAGIISMVQPNSETTVESRQALFEEENKTTISENEYVVETICRDFESLGYSVQPVVIPACAVGAPHRRDRIWFIAHANATGLTDRGEQHRGESAQIREREHSIGGCCVGVTPDPDSNGLDRCNSEYEVNTGEGGFDALNDIEQNVVVDTTGIGYGGRTEKTRNITSGKKRTMVQRSRRNRSDIRSKTERYSQVDSNTCNKGLQRDKFNRAFDEGKQKQSESYKPAPELYKKQNWRNFPTQPPVRSRNDGISSELVGITVSKHRIESIKAYGNAIVPQVAFEIFKVIERLENANGN